MSTKSTPAEDPEQTKDSFQTKAPSIALPKGGGAIRGIGEKFAANPVTGTGSMTVPIATSQSRSGFGPQLSLAYDSGNANSPFGLGFRLSLPSITRRTDKGVPQYRDAEESDVFILSGAEDLVPVLKTNGDRFEDKTTVPGYTIHRYRPRIEGLFARIERWTDQTTGDVHWRSFSKDNVLTVYGGDSNSRIADPEDSSRIFSWLICEARDDKGNAVVYSYKPEDGVGVELDRACERNRGDRNDARRSANRYLKRVRYGNRLPLLDDAGQRPRFISDTQFQGADWMFEVVLDYGEHNTDMPMPDDPGQWCFRKDSFSVYRAGFEVRTTRLCRRVLMFHHFGGEGGVGNDCLVRSTDFTYSYELDYDHSHAPIYTFLRAVSQSGYRRVGGGYVKRSLPPVEFEYTEPVVQDRVDQVDPGSLENLPVGVDGVVYRWTDLHGEGIPGILTEQADAWYYKRNLSPIATRPVKFGPLERVAIQPNLALAGGAQFMDLAGDGQPDLVALDGPTPGLYEHDGSEGWQPFRPFTSRLNRDMRDPNLRLVDLDGDGYADVLISEDDAFVWHASLAEGGFGPAHRIDKVLDEEKGPRLVFADATESIHLADLSGDGLTDLVRIRNGEVCYWPNLGRRFGRKVTMDQAPCFDNPDQFDHKRIRLADIDGSGTTDIIYLHRDGVRLHFNQSGNSWSPQQKLTSFPGVNNLASVVPTDLFGNGTVCLVWSSALPGGTQQQMRYVDLVGGQKPHLLVKTVNNLGAETRVQYAPSTKFYLKDKYDGNPWITRLPFPVHVVERVETYDHVSGNRFTTRYAYHHGHFDGAEREFRGFGMVERLDTEGFAALTGNGTAADATNVDAVSHVPPVLTRTWYHTGIYVGRDHVSDFFGGQINAQDEGEYYREPGLTDSEAKQRLLPDTILPGGLTLQEEREACRALKGAILREEIYARDGLPREEHPYTVTEQNFTIRCLQPRGANRHGVFFTHAREVINYHYERNPVDPRVSHDLTLEVDPYGTVLKEVAIGYGRRTASTDPILTTTDRTKQTRLLITCTENRPTNAIDDLLLYPDDYRTPLMAETLTYEITGARPDNAADRFSFDEWTRDNCALLASAEEIPYEQVANGITLQTRIIEHVRLLYRKNDLTAFSPTGQVESLALPGESYKLALTQGLVNQVFRRKQAAQPDEMLLTDPTSLLEGRGNDQGGYVSMDGAWWVPSGRSFFDPAANVDDPASTAVQELIAARGGFYLPCKVADPFGHTTVIDYDVHHLLATGTRDALGNRVTAVNDYRVLQPSLVTDPNRNRTAAVFDALAMVVATATMGKAGENQGDVPENLDADPPLMDLQAFIADPQTHAKSLLGNATSRIVYDLGRYKRVNQPPLAAKLVRETHFHDPLPEDSLKIQISFSYSDGFGREVQRKIQAEAGDAPERQAQLILPSGDVHVGDLIRDALGNPVLADCQHRWVGSGRRVFNNKGKPVRQYEPFFSATHLYEPERDMTDTGVSPVLFYDPAERVIATLHPDHTYEKVLLDAWSQTTYDVNDTVACSGDQTGDPRTDPDIEGYVYEYFKNQPAAWETWYAQRASNQMGDAERDASQKASIHAGTPTVTHFDTLGRPLVTILHNKYERNGEVLEERLCTRTELDVEGNQRVLRDAMIQSGDAQGRIVMRYDYDMLGNRIHQASMEAGERWSLNDVAGNPIRCWDSRLFLRRMTYDLLRRRNDLYVTENGAERLAERIAYGEDQGDGANHRTRVYQIFDGAGVITNVSYDFKGNLLESRRDLLHSYRQEVDWQLDPAADNGSFVGSTTYDAANRPLTVTSPDGSVSRSTYNEANLLNAVEVRLRGTAAFIGFVKNIDYDAKGQRTLIEYANGVKTALTYDPLTSHLKHLKTTRPVGMNGPASGIFADPSVVQDIYHTYDPAGNIVRVEDAALETVVYSGQEVMPVSSYTYDALYRLIEAHGREHIGQTTSDFSPTNADYRDYPFAGYRVHPNDLHALRNYTERYEYDAAGSLRVMRHIGEWQRAFDHGEESLIEAGKQSNRLTSTTVGNGLHRNDPYSYDAHGNMVTMPHLTEMIWDFEDQLREVDLGGGGTAYNVYDASGKRVRKIIESQSGALRTERIYFSGFEICRVHSGSQAGLVRESLHVMDNKSRIAIVETRNDVDDGCPAQLIRYQFGNHLDSASVELDKDGALIAYEEYHPFGTTGFQTGRSSAEVSLKRFRYTGTERDRETGLYYHGARYYAPWLGIWTSVDPEGVADGLNTYQYARANPSSFLDTTGLQAEYYNELALARSSGDQKMVHALEVLQSAPQEMRAKAAQYAADWRKFQKQSSVPWLSILFPSHTAPYLRDPGAGIKDPLLQFQARFNQHAALASGTFHQHVGAVTSGVCTAIMLAAMAMPAAVELAPGAAAAIGRIATGTTGLINELGIRTAIQFPRLTEAITAIASGMAGVSSPSGPAAQVTVRVFRVEGTPNARIAITSTGGVIIQGAKTLFLNFGSRTRAREFLSRRIAQGMPNASIKSFEVPKAFLEDLRASAVAEHLSKQFPGRPIIVDVTKALDQFGLRGQSLDKLITAAIQGSGKVEQ